MQLSSSIAALAFAITTLAKPVSDKNCKREAVTGSNTNGSIFMFGSASNCRKAFWERGACGLSTYFEDKVDPSMPLVALPSGVFDKYGQAQGNTLCAKVITMTRDGVTQKAVVADENTSNEQSIDMCLDMWQAFGGKDQDGSLRRGIEWSIAA